MGIVWIVPIAFFLSQNAYFGWNFSPKSDAELIADGITGLMILLAFLITHNQGA